jgi:Spy/CpxP family protein refolding chaperone
MLLLLDHETTKEFIMRQHVLAAAVGFCLCSAVYADDPPAPAAAPAPAPATAAPVPPAAAPDPAQPPRTHIDTTVIGSDVPDPSAGSAAAGLDNDHNFVAGAPEVMRIASRLHLSPAQLAKLQDVIEQSDAGAAALIQREHDVRQMIAATTPADPQYAKLIADQSVAAARWQENRANLRRAVLDILTPAQQKHYAELEAGST